jgi:diguanylate cyclase
MLIFNMLTSLFANFCILVTFVFLSGSLSRRYNFSSGTMSPLASVLAGLMFGVFGMILMSYSFPVGPGTYANLRHLAMIIAGAYLGWLPAAVCAVLLSVSRVIFYDITYNSVSAAITLLLCGACCSWISLLSWSRLRKMTVSNLICMAVVFVLLLNNLGSLEAVMQFFPLELVTSLATGLIIYYVAEYIQRSNELFNHLEVRATTDFLTGLNNRQQFQRHLEDELIRATQQQECVSLLAVDIDHFKTINDTYGHPAGDEILVQLARRLFDNARPNDIVSRNGGEEFSVLMPDCTLEKAEQAGERIRAAVDQEMFVLPNGLRVAVTISVGAASCPHVLGAAGIRLLPHHADQALYQAKNTGRNRVCSSSIQEVNHRPASLLDHA